MENVCATKNGLGGHSATRAHGRAGRQQLRLEPASGPHVWPSRFDNNLNTGQRCYVTRGGTENRLAELDSDSEGAWHVPMFNTTAPE